MALNIWSAAVSITWMGPSPTCTSGPVGCGGGVAPGCIKNPNRGMVGNTVWLPVTIASSSFTVDSCAAPPMSPVPTYL